MKFPTVIAIGLYAVMPINTAPASATATLNDSKEITILVRDVDASRGGNIIVMIFAKDGFPKQHDKTLQQQVRPANDPNMAFNFSVVENEIAIKILHDEDENGKVTKNWTGIYPGEGLGFSQKQKVGMFGPPKFRKSKIRKDELPEILPISIRYPQKKG